MRSSQRCRTPVTHRPVGIWTQVLEICGQSHGQLYPHTNDWVCEWVSERVSECLFLALIIPGTYKYDWDLLRGFTRTHTWTHTHTHTHARARTHTHSHTHIYIYIYSKTRIYRYTRSSFYRSYINNIYQIINELII